MVGNKSIVAVPVEEEEAQNIRGQSYDHWENFMQETRQIRISSAVYPRFL
jgi:hypothetical protein